MSPTIIQSAGRVLMRWPSAEVLSVCANVRSWLGLPRSGPLPADAPGWPALADLVQALVASGAGTGAENLGHGRGAWRGLNLAWRRVPLLDAEGGLNLLMVLQPTDQPEAPPAPPPALRSAAPLPLAPGAGPAQPSARVGQLLALAQSVPGTLYQYQLRTDGTGWFPYAGPAIESLLGVAPARLAEDSNHALRHVHPEDVGRFLRGIAVTLTSMAPWRLDFRVELPGRGLRWVRGVAQPERLADGSTLWHGHMWDITDEQPAGPGPGPR